MGRPTSGDRKYTVENIWDVHREVMRLAVTGMKSVDIAAALGVTEAMVSYTINSPICKRQLDNMRAARDIDAVSVAKRIQEIAPRAVEVLEGLLEDGNDAIKLRAATDVLDRAGHAAVRTLRTESLSLHLNKDDIDDIKARARSIGLCVDTTDADMTTVQEQAVLPLAMPA